MKNYCLLFTFVFVCNLLLHAEDSIMYNYDATMCVNGKWRFYTCCIAWRHELCADDGRSAAHQKKVMEDFVASLNEQQINDYGIGKIVK